MRFCRTLLGLALMALLTAACQGRIAPLSAQQGSTIVIPLEGVDFLEADPPPGEFSLIGYGGRDVSDPQRGMLVYHLDASDGFELVTVGTSRVNADGARAGQIVSLVEIPVDAPLGSHALYVEHRRFDPATGSWVGEPGPDYNGELQILPESITVDLPGGGSEEIVGSPTPFEVFFSTVGWLSISTSYLQDAVPPPEIRVKVNAEAPVWAVEVIVLVPVAVAEVLDIRDPGSVNHPASVWLQDFGPAGSLNRYVGDAVASSVPIDTIAFPFRLENASSALLDPASVIAIPTAWDQDGNSISATASVTIF